MNYPTFQSKQSQTQTLMVEGASGYGPTLDLGADAVGLVGLITATIKDVNLDGGTPGTLGITVIAGGSFNGSDWDTNPVLASGTYSNPQGTVGQFFADDPTPLYAQALMSRYMRFGWTWINPSDIGVNASATITLVVDYF